MSCKFKIQSPFKTFLKVLLKAVFVVACFVLFIFFIVHYPEMAAVVVFVFYAFYGFNYF